MFDQSPPEEDFYETLDESSYGEYKEKGSKFLAFAHHVSSENECAGLLNELRKKHPKARHHCYAYRLQPEDPLWRANDDGEPSNSAGMPIFNQILSSHLWNVIVIVVRYYGGTKLGVSGLINAYKSATAQALEQAKSKTNYITREIVISFPYSLMNEVMRVIKDDGLQINNESMGADAGYSLLVRKNKYEEAIDKLAAFHQIKIHNLTT